MPCHHTKHVRNVGPVLFVHNENNAHVMPRVTAHAVTSCAHCTVHALTEVCINLQGVPPTEGEGETIVTP